MGTPEQYRLGLRVLVDELTTAIGAGDYATAHDVITAFRAHLDEEQP
jgi:hypothetical protein